MNKKLRDSSWARIINHINDNYKVGDILKRQTLIKNIKGVPTSTIDGYRNRLQRIFILKQAGRGKYKLLQKIPEGLNTIVLWDLMYEQRKTPYVRWFIPLQERVNRLLNKK